MNIRTLKEKAIEAFTLCISFHKDGKTNEAFLQYGRGKAYMAVLAELTAERVSTYAPEIKELDDTAWICLYREV